jgi:hypothetical protein
MEYISWVAIEHQKMAFQWLNTAPFSHAARLRHSAASFKAQSLYIVCFMGRLGDAEAWARSMSLLNRVMCTPAINLIALTLRS